MNDEQRQETPAYIARCRGCNAVVGAMVDDGNHLDHIAEFVAEQILADCIIERTNVKEARKLFGSCTCQLRTHDE